MVVLSARQDWRGTKTSKTMPSSQFVALLISLTLITVAASITARFNPTTIDSPPGVREITIPDVPSGGTLHVVSKALGRVNTGSTCTTPGCAPIVQGEDSKGGTPAGRIVISRNEVLMDRSSGVIEGPTSVSRPGNLKPGWEVRLAPTLLPPRSLIR